MIAAYNEAGRLGAALDALRRWHPHVVVVDDGSDDDTADVALGRDVWVVRHPANCGQGAALQTGIDFALARGAEVLVTFDADGQHVASEIARLIEPIVTGRVDVSLGSRTLGRAVGLPWSRWMVLKVGVLFTRVFSRIHVTDTHNGFRAFSRLAARRMRITHNRMAHASEILDEIRRNKLRFCEVPVTVHYARETLAKGQSSWNAFRIVAQLVAGKLIR